MSKIIIISTGIALAIAVLVSSGIIDSLVIFLLSGVLPGTSLQIPSGVMLVGFFSIAWLLVARSVTSNVKHFYEVHRLTRRYSARQSAMPKRRYSRI